MPLTVRHDCPYCQTKNCQYEVNSYHIRETEYVVGRGQYYADVVLFGICGGCQMGVTIHCQWWGDNTANGSIAAALKGQNGYVQNHGFQVIDIFPQAVTNLKPANLPDRIGQLYEQAQSALMQGHWDSSGAMSRKCLDVSTKTIAREKLIGAEQSEVLKSWLKKRIALLGEKKLITQELADLAVVIKDEGDDAAHDEDPFTEDEANSLLEYTAAFLTYAHTVPAMIEQAKQKYEVEQ